MSGAAWAWVLFFLAIWAGFLRWRLSGWAWGKGLIAPHALAAVAALAVQGLGHWQAPGQEFALLLGWALFLLGLVLPNRLMALWLAALMALDLPRARALAERMGLFWWGPARLWVQEATEAIALAARSGPGAPPSPTLRPEGLPKAWRQVASGLKHQSMALRQAWHEELASPCSLPPWPLAQAARRARAHLELGDAAGAEEALALAQADQSPGRPEMVAGTAVTLLALLGDRQGVAEWQGASPQALGPLLWDILAEARSGAPDLAQARLLGLAQSLEERGELNEELAARLQGLGQALDRPLAEEAPRLIPLWRARFRRWWQEARLGHPSGLDWVLGFLLLAMLLPHLIVHSAWVHAHPTGLAWSQWLWWHGPLRADAFFDLGEWQRLPLSWFLHADAYHLASNLLAMVVLWPYARAWLGLWGALAAFLAGGLGGGMAHLMWAGPQPVVGASGNALGLVGAALSASFAAGRQAPWWVRRRLWGVLLPVALLQLVLDPFLPQVAAWAHAGGLAGGLFLGLAWGAWRWRAQGQVARGLA